MVPHVPTRQPSAWLMCCARRRSRFVLRPVRLFHLAGPACVLSGRARFWAFIVGVEVSFTVWALVRGGVRFVVFCWSRLACCITTVLADSGRCCLTCDVVRATFCMTSRVCPQPCAAKLGPLCGTPAAWGWPHVLLTSTSLCGFGWVGRLDGLAGPGWSLIRCRSALGLLSPEPSVSSSRHAAVWP